MIATVYYFYFKVSDSDGVLRAFTQYRKPRWRLLSQLPATGRVGISRLCYLPIPLGPTWEKKAPRRILFHGWFVVYSNTFYEDIRWRRYVVTLYIAYIHIVFAINTEGYVFSNEDPVIS